MRIAIGADHAGFALKEVVLAHLAPSTHDVLDCGIFEEEASDYPDTAEKVALQLHTQEVDRGILICGSGVGVSVAANKLPGIRAAVCHDAYSAAQGVEHDDMNVLVLGARIIGVQLALVLVDAFLAAEFTGEERHVRRLGKIAQLERNFPTYLD